MPSNLCIPNIIHWAEVQLCLLRASYIIRLCCVYLVRATHKFVLNLLQTEHVADEDTWKAIDAAVDTDVFNVTCIYTVIRNYRRFGRSYFIFSVQQSEFLNPWFTIFFICCVQFGAINVDLT